MALGLVGYEIAARAFNRSGRRNWAAGPTGGLAYRALVESQKHLAAELAEAVTYVKSLLPQPLQGEVTADWRFIRSSQLGGDAFGYR